MAAAIGGVKARRASLDGIAGSFPIRTVDRFEEVHFAVPFLCTIS